MPLTDVKIRQAKSSDKLIKLTDGSGLYLEVKPNGSKLWRYRYRIVGKENLFAVGGYPAISLQDARKDFIAAVTARANQLGRTGTPPKKAKARLCASNTISWDSRG